MKDEGIGKKEEGKRKCAKGTANKQLQAGSKFRISLQTENQAKMPDNLKVAEMH